ncbi:hypothetical protein CGZ80_01355 [Rhodopirellula sp. MGV]|nr:hypothetical protein CGZ80_01355 [Rhodopirellula sp. MGV]PNY38292.1 hypothetical protein C2E31_02980 [Rhodopirellula baltica]
MILEANYLVRVAQWSIEDACDLIGIPSESFYVSTETRLPYTPTPDEIEEAIAAIQRGEADIDGRAVKRRREDAAFREWNESIDEYDLGGDIEEDHYTMPSWFRG